MQSEQLQGNLQGIHLLRYGLVHLSEVLPLRVKFALALKTQQP